MTPFDHLLHRARVTNPATPFDAWIETKRDEAQRLNRDNYRQWLRDGAQPAPRFGKVDA